MKHPENQARARLAEQGLEFAHAFGALQRLAGSYILGGIAAWKLLTYPDGGSQWILAMWVGLALLAFGLASFDQVAKIFKR